jgi:hypothetical protein
MTETPFKVRRSKWRTITVNVEVDAEVRVIECLEMLDDEDLIEELEKRDLAKKRIEVTDDRDELLREALDCLRHGDAEEATLLLERVLFPKFKSVELCEREFKLARGVSVSPQDQQP